MDTLLWSLMGFLVVYGMRRQYLNCYWGEMLNKVGSRNWGIGLILMRF